MPLKELAEYLVKWGGGILGLLLDLLWRAITGAPLAGGAVFED